MKLPVSLIVMSTLLSTSVQSTFGDPRAMSRNDTERHSYNAGRQLSIGWIVYEGYLPLDLWGPLQVFTTLSNTYNMTLSIISETMGPVSSANPSTPLEIVSRILATHTPATAPPLDLLLLPGGLGNRDHRAAWAAAFSRSRANSTDYIASVCTGSLLLAQAGILTGKRATTNKKAWNAVLAGSQGMGVDWVPNARWTQDGRVWTSSGVAAGMDMAYALLGWMYGTDELNKTMNTLELSPHVHSDWDPYAVVHNVPGADRSRPMKDLVGPVGYD